MNFVFLELKKPKKQSGKIQIQKDFFLNLIKDLRLLIVKLAIESSLE
jgi:hypothetical protein